MANNMKTIVAAMTKNQKRIPIDNVTEADRRDITFS